MSKHAPKTKAAGARAKGKKPKGQERAPKPEIVRVGTAKEVTQGNSTKDLDGYYGPGWTRYW